jgi:uncharacterized membrane protein YccC
VAARLRRAGRRTDAQVSAPAPAPAQPAAAPAERDWSDLTAYFVGLVAVVAACYAAISLVLGPLSVTVADLGLGRMWSVVAGVFVFHLASTETRRQGVVRISATLVSVLVCLGYLALAPTTWWGLSVVVAVSAAVPLVYGRRSDAVTAAITSTVILQVAATTHDVRTVIPLLRLLDTVVGTVVGLVVGALVAAVLHRERRDPRRDPGPSPEPPITASGTA